MRGLSLKTIKEIKKIIESKFDLFNLMLLGILPKDKKQIDGGKKMYFTTSKHKNLIELFIDALDDKPNKAEEIVLKKILSGAKGYVDSLKEKTIARIIHDLDSYVTEQSQKKEPIDKGVFDSIINQNMKRSGNHFKMIANTESNRAVNYAVSLQIKKIAKDKKIDDPVVFFVVTIDDVTGPEEFVLHLLPDRKTPRVWKLSELSYGYHKKGDPNPSIGGLHVNCRCKLTVLMPGFGFDKDGKVRYVGPDHDEFKVQRNKYGLPR